MAIPIVLCGALITMPHRDGAVAGADEWRLRPEKSAEQRYVQGLRSRRLFALATSYCRRQLARPDLAEKARAELVSELMQSLAAQASASPPEQRAPLWQRAHDAASEFAQRWPDHPFGLIVELQDALVWLAEGEVARYASSLAGQPDGGLQQARRALRRAIRELEQVRDRIEQQDGRSLDRTDTTRSPWTKSQLASLDNHCAYQLARAFRNQALCYPPESPDRVNSLTRAIETLSALANHQPSDTLAARSQIEQAECLRWLGKLDAARQVLEALDPAQMPAATASRWEAEWIRWMLAADQTTEAVARATAGRPNGAVHGEREIARLEAILADWRQAASSGHQDVARRRMDQATEAVRRIEQRLGSYWSRRAQRLLADLATSPQTQHDPQALLRAAEGLLHGGNRDEAVRLYDRVAKLARQQDDAPRARQAAFAAATIRRRQGRHSDAATRYRDVALEDPRWPQAAEAHLLSAFHAAQHARDGSADTRGPAISRYEALLQEHLGHWPSGPTAHRARLWLADLRRSQHQWSQALDLYHEIPDTSAVYDQALSGVARIYNEWLLSREANVGHEQLRRALDDLRHLLLGQPQQWPSQWTPGRRSVALTVARILLDNQSAARQAKAVLQRALAGPPGAERPWADRARLLLAVAEARQQNVDEARALFENSRSAVDAQTLLDAVQLLIEDDRQHDAESRKATAKLALPQLEQLAADDDALSETQRSVLWQLRARAWLQAGNRQEALQAYAKLARERPGDAAAQQAYADMLSTSTDPATLNKALAQWAAIQRKCRVGSDRWFRARYGQARVYFQLGNRDKCARLIELTRVLMPELGGPTMKAQFMELAARCRTESNAAEQRKPSDARP